MLVRNADHILQLSDAPELSQRAVYADVSLYHRSESAELQPMLIYMKIFGFKHTMKHTTVELDPNEQTAARYRLYSRAIRIIGMAQISALQPYLQARLQEALYRHIDSKNLSNGIIFP